MTKQRFNKKKMKELILFVSSLNKDSPAFGSTALNKMLFYSDVFAFLLHGKSITGASYVKEKYGPVPKELMEVRRELLRESALEIQEVERSGKIQRRPVSLRGTNERVFSQSEITIIRDVITQLQNQSAISVSEISHKEFPWLVANEGEEIPYSSFFLRRVNPIPRAIMGWAQKVTKKQPSEAQRKSA